MGAGADPGIVPALPVDEIVPRPGGLAAGMVGDFIGLEAGRLQDVLGVVEEGRGMVLIRRDQPTAGERPGEGRARLDGQLIGRDVLGPRGQGLAKLGGPGRAGLVGPGIDQVEGQSGKEIGGQGQRPAGGRRVMVATQEGEGGVVKGLHPQGQAIDARGGEVGEAAGLGVGGIGLQADLQIRIGAPQAAGAGDDVGHQLGRGEGGRAAAEEDGHQPPRPGERGLGGEVAEQGGGQVLGFAPPSPGAIDVEAAIGADARALGPAHIEAERRRLSRLKRAALRWAKARARWLMASLAAGSISPKVSSRPSGAKMGSYPKPRSPRPGKTSRPSTRPSTTRAGPSMGQATASAQVKKARASETPRAASRVSTSFMARAKSLSGPAQRAE